MHEYSDQHAMAEVALALAFFSIMVLAMVSMSLPRAEFTPVATTAAAPNAEASGELKINW